MSTLAGDLYRTLQGPTWDDLRAPATSIPLQGQSGDPDRDTDGSLLFDAGSVEQASVIYQMPHAWYYGTGIRFHMHWGKTTDAPGAVLWQMRYRVFGNGTIPPAWSAWIDSNRDAFEVGADQTCNVAAFPEISMTGEVGSAMVSIQFRRKADDVTDTYAADARLWEADCHYQDYATGSSQEFPT